MTLDSHTIRLTWDASTDNVGSLATAFCAMDGTSRASAMERLLFWMNNSIRHNLHVPGASIRCRGK